MRFHRVNKLFSLLMAFMLVFSNCSFFSVASGEGAVGSTTAGDDAGLVDVCDLTQNEVSGVDYKFRPRDLINPNINYVLPLTFSDRDGYKLPRNSNYPMVFPMAGYRYVKVEDGSNDVVSWTYDPDGNQLVFNWTGTPRESFSADISYTLQDGLVSSTNLDKKTYVLARYNGSSKQVNTVSDTPAESGTMLAASVITLNDDGTYTARNGVTAWTFEHVSDNWYKIHSGDKYLEITSTPIDSTHSTLKTVSASEAKALYVSYTSGGISIKNAENYYLNDKGNGSKKRFQSYKAFDKGAVFYMLPEQSSATVQIAFDSNGTDVEMPEAISGTIGSQVSLPKPVNKPYGYDFAGWSTSTKAEGLITNPDKYIVSGDSPLYAIWVENISVTARVIWNDNDNEKGKRPDSVKIRLKANGVAIGDDVELTKENLYEAGEWVYTFGNLSATDEKGKAIIYTVDEETPPYGYTASFNGYIITNTMNPTVTITKKLVGEIWIVRCDVMDTTEFTNDNGEVWKTDVISNPLEILKNEGHRDTKCGNKDHWVIWVGGDGRAYRMDEIKSGATGSTLTTKLFRPVNNLTTKQIQNMTPKDTGLVAQFAQNFVHPMSWSEVKIGERIYWITWNGDKIWYHSGIPEKADLKYMLYINGKSYPIAANGEVVLEDLSPGIYTIKEEKDPQCYLGTVSVTGGATVTQPDNSWYATVTIPETPDNIDIEWPNVIKIPDDPPPPPPPPEQELTSATVKKYWDDNENVQDRPEKIKVTLLANGKEVKTVTLSAEDGWEYTEEDLPLKSVNASNVITDIEYTWAEKDLPDGYLLTVNETEKGTEGTVTSMKNTRAVDLTVVKVWDDGDNRDSKRPESLNVVLSSRLEKDDTPVKLLEGNVPAIDTPDDEREGHTVSVTLNEDNGWSETVENLPLYVNGEKIKYTWEEDEEGLPEGYELSDTSVNGTITTLTNSYEPEETEASVKKVWDDADDKDGKRPDSLEVKLLADGKETDKSVTLTAEKNWEDTLEHLPKNANGKEIVYTWTESGLPEGYELSDTSVNGTITTLTNSHTPEETQATVKKVWDDAGNQDGIRPAELKVTLSNGTEVTLNEANGWTATLDHLPKYASGKEIVYTWTESGLPEGYELSDTSVNGTVTTLTNSHTPEETEATVIKVWDDAGNQDGIRPAELKVTLSNGTEVTLNEANGWTATLDHLPKYASGKEIVYTWTESGLPEGYELSDTSVNGTVTTLTNSHTPEETEATVIKVWDDAGNQDGIRPAELKVTLSNGMEVTLNEANGWTATLDHLPKYASGKEIVYTWTESGLPEGYELSDTSVNGTVTTLTNTHAPEMITLTVKKIWQDQDNQLKQRPESIRITLNNAITVILNEANQWSAEITDLPVYKEGQIIEYTWTEQTVLGYTQVSAVTEGNETVFTNRLYDREQDQPTQPAQGGRVPRMAGKPTDTIEDYGTPLGIDTEYNHAGDCFD